MAARQIIVPGAMPSRNANGRALPALLRFYMPETTTPAVVYTDAALTIPHEFPILSDAGGRWPQIWADETSSFSVGWSDQVFDAIIATFSNVQTLKDALLASADIANTAADAAIAAQAASEEIAEKFGDVDAAITAAQGAQTGAETAETNAETAETNTEAARDLALQYRNEAEQFRDEAEEIAGFDPTTYVNTASAQAFSVGAKLQARTNIGAQPVLGVMDREKVSRPSIVAGVLTLDASAASRFEVEWDQDITDIIVNGLPADTDSTSWTVVLTHGDAPLFGITPIGEYHWQGDTYPDFEANAKNFIVMTTTEAGAWVDMFFAGWTRV